MEMSNFFQISNAQSIFNQLGTTVDNVYVPYNDCHLALTYIYDKLNTEDNNAIEYRQIIGFSQLVKNNLIPMLITIKNEKTLELLIKILASIMSPIESLMPVANDPEEKDRCSIILKLNWVLTINKVECANIKAIRRIVNMIKNNMSQLVSFNEAIVNQHHQIIIDCLSLIKNILYVPNDQYQDQILKMLFIERFDELQFTLEKRCRFPRFFPNMT